MKQYKRNHLRIEAQPGMPDAAGEAAAGVERAADDILGDLIEGNQHYWQAVREAKETADQEKLQKQAQRKKKREDTALKPEEDRGSYEEGGAARGEESQTWKERVR